MFFVFLWPLFARAPRHWFPENFLLSAPGVQSVFFCCAPLGAATFRRGQSKKKENTTQGVFFFALAPCRRPTGLLLPLPFAGAAAKKKTPWVVFFFLLWPRAGAQRGFSFPCLSPGPQQKTKIPWVVFFFCCGPARTLTHPLRAWVAMPPPRRGGVFFFAAAPPGPGWCFVFLLWPRPDAHSLTVGWGDFGKARVVFCFLLRPRRVFLDNNKKCLGYYIGSKKTRRGHSKKKTPLP